MKKTATNSLKLTREQLITIFWWLVFFVLTGWNVWLLWPNITLPIILVMFVFAWLNIRKDKFSSYILNVKNDTSYYFLPEYPETTFKDVFGLDNYKRELTDIIDYLKNPSKYDKQGISIPVKILFSGPHGTGKTLMVYAVAGEAKVPFYKMKAVEIVQLFDESGVAGIRNLFQLVKANAPAILFIDDLDHIEKLFGEGSSKDKNIRAIKQLFFEIEGLEKQYDIVFFAAVSNPDLFDSKLFASSYFDRQIRMRLPIRSEREKILEQQKHTMKLSNDVDLALISRSTTGFSGEDLTKLCQKAKLNANHAGYETLRMIDFEEALEQIVFGSGHNAIMSDHDQFVVACHEAGHGMIAWLSPYADLVQKISIFPDELSMVCPDVYYSISSSNLSREYLLANIRVMLGGRAAEELLIGDVTTGSEGDLLAATRLAKYMNTRWGMGGLGLMAIPAEKESNMMGSDIFSIYPCSEETIALLDRSVQQLLNEQYDVVKELLKKSLESLTTLVETLQRDEILDYEDLMEIIGPKVYGED